MKRKRNDGDNVDIDRASIVHFKKKYKTHEPPIACKTKQMLFSGGQKEHSIPA